MNPREFEEAVARPLRSEGYTTELQSYVGDFGVDVIATRRDERLAVQAKMYGGTTRPVNRQMVMELYGAAAYLDCTGAILATDGRILEDAAGVTEKLGIRVLDMGGAWVEHAGPTIDDSLPATTPDARLEFAEIWERWGRGVRTRRGAWSHPDCLGFLTDDTSTGGA